MAGKTLIGGTAYTVIGGKTLVGGTAYSISKGKTLVGGTGYDITFTAPTIVLVDDNGESPGFEWDTTYIGDCTLVEGEAGDVGDSRNYLLTKLKRSSTKNSVNSAIWYPSVVNLTGFSKVYSYGYDMWTTYDRPRVLLNSAMGGATTQPYWDMRIPLTNTNRLVTPTVVWEYDISGLTGNYYIGLGLYRSSQDSSASSQAMFGKTWLE